MRTLTFIKALFLPILLLSTSTMGEEVRSLSPKTLFIAGDSTAASYINADHQGWGAPFVDYFDSSEVKVDNRARGGRSSRTFISEGLWQTLIDDVNVGDVVIIQFGHNDGSPINDDRRARGTLPGIGDTYVDIVNQLTGKQERVYTYGHYIRQMVAEVKAKQATPILASLTVRNLWQAQRIERGSGDYNYWMYQLAWELDTPFIDLTNAAADELEKIGKKETTKLYPKDHTHFHNEGADLHARLVVAALKGMRPALDKSLYSDKGNAVAAYDWTFVRLPIVSEKNRRSVFMVGDSTVRNGRGDGRNGQWGWGDFVSNWLGEPALNIVNRAVGGLSSRTFITQGHWQRALNMMKPGDIVLIQFGHNDAGKLNDDNRARGTIKGVGNDQITIDNMLTGQRETVYTYGTYLRTMIGEARAVGVTPIICSPVPRKQWQENMPRIARASNSYPQWAAHVARQSQTLFIDLHNLVATRYDSLGVNKVDAMFADEHTHTSKAGAIDTAKIVAQQLSPILGISVVEQVSNEGE